MFDLLDLKAMRTGSNRDAENAIIEREGFIQGREGYPTAPPQSLPQGVSERYRGCYMMGYNLSEFEDREEV